MSVPRARVRWLVPIVIALVAVLAFLVFFNRPARETTVSAAPTPSTASTAASPGAVSPATAAGFSPTERRLQVAMLTNGPVSDWGFNYAQDQGLQTMGRALGDRVRIGTVENVPETGDAERVMRRLIDSGVGVIIAASFGYQDTTVKLAQQFPNVRFLQAWGFKPARNLGTYSAQMYEAWYVQGILAGSMTKSNKLGVVAAHPIPPMKWQINAFVLGARSVNPKVEASVTYINHWFDPGLAAEATEALIAQGADVVTGVLDNSVAVAQTAEKRGVYLIGHNADLSRFAPTMCLASTEWLWGKLYEDVLAQMLANQWSGTGGDVHGGLAKGYVGVTQFSPKVPANIQKKATTALEELRAGTLAVYRGPIKDRTGKVVVKPGEVMPHEAIMAIDWLVEGVK